MTNTADHPTSPVAVLADSVMVIPWEDPVVERYGVEVHSEYVARFWLSVLGPTATWILRLMAGGLARYPFGYEQDLAELAATVGLSKSMAVNGPFGRALQRCEIFGVSRTVPGGLAVRRKLPPLSARQVARLPEALQQAHQRWRQPGIDGELDKARLLAAAFRDIGDSTEAIERHLLALGLSPTTATTVAAEADQRSARVSPPAFSAERASVV